MNNQENLEELAHDFLSSVDEATFLLEEKFGTRCILRLWSSEKIKRCGVVKGNVTYELHGVGCAVNLPHVLVDFDYGPDGRTDGFDAWRLFIYASELPEKHPKYQSKEVLNLEFEEYVASGRFEPMPKGRNGFYCLSKNN
ncbi:hypothetical protein [Pseudomonas sp. T1.Ur]|uniref:DUF6896 domain-containing protein n=1 Tax=Pseudomonas sp. T1.Ur TaxID=2928704 RepID=UPI00201E2FAD|nr:hypothetical protein [Pseudomonas sp. T1.Ur]MCL6700924.1 hypothetical protein [Pseudomonas sp. T1.Ur]